MNRLQILFAFLLGAATLGSVDPAQAATVLTPQMLQMADTNRDGQVTIEEAQALVPMLTQEVFDGYDLNGDGVLSSADLPEPPHEPGQILRHLLEVADADANGEVTLEEAQAVYPDATPQQFQELDRNGDNVLSAADLPPAPPQDPLEALVHILSMADANFDSAITFEEAQAVIPAMTRGQFDYLDANGDGVLTRDDLPAALPEDPVRRLLNLLRQADTDNDNAISYDEILVLVPEYPRDAFDVLDINGDGVLSFADLPAGPVTHEQLLALLRQADVNEDQEVTFEELQALVPQVTQEQFDELDRNGDGVISKADLPQAPPENLYMRLLRLFKEADANQDEQITLAELQAVIPTFTQHAFDYIDANGDGVISRDDLPDGPPPTELEMLKHLLRMADADDNGEVTFAELQALVPELVQEQFDRLDRNGDGVISAADLPSLPEDPMEWLLRVLREADANGDGQVTFEELQAVAPSVTQEQFDRLDRNGDGVISVEDKPDAPADPLERLIRLLREADVDENEQVTFAELQAVYPELTQEQFDTLDRNGDGVISAADLPDTPEDPRDRLLRLLRELDANEDKQLTLEE
ncbi:MAG: EF-hand domain-containing protein, partial [FCB group bacterium]|nr:EF-hand domain-containing protein [FCB group bacterium]